MEPNVRGYAFKVGVPRSHKARLVIVFTRLDFM